MKIYSIDTPTTQEVPVILHHYPDFTNFNTTDQAGVAFLRVNKQADGSIEIVTEPNLEEIEKDINTNNLYLSDDYLPLISFYRFDNNTMIHGLADENIGKAAQLLFNEPAHYEALSTYATMQTVKEKHDTHLDIIEHFLDTLTIEFVQMIKLLTPIDATEATIIKEYATPDKKLGVLFMREDTRTTTSCTAYAFEDNEGYFDSQDIQQGIIEPELHTKIGNIEGLIPLATLDIPERGKDATRFTIRETNLLQEEDATSESIKEILHQLAEKQELHFYIND